MRTIGVAIAVIVGARGAEAGELVVPPAQLAVSVDDADAAAWQVAGDALVAVGERIALDVEPIDGDRTCAALLDGPLPSDQVAATAASLGLPAAVHATMRIERRERAVQRLGCVQGTRATLTFAWIAQPDETDAQRASAARVLGAIAAAFGASEASEATTLPAATPPRHRAPPRRTAAAARPAPAEPDLATRIGPPLGRELMAPHVSLGFQQLLPTDAMTPTSAEVAVLIARPIVPIGTTALGYEFSGALAAGGGRTVALSSRAGLGYHLVSGLVGLYAIGGVAFDWIDAGDPTSFELPAEPGAYAAALMRTFLMDHLLIDLRAARVWRVGRADAIDGSIRLAWTPDERREYTLDLYMHDYDGHATVLGVALGYGL